MHSFFNVELTIADGSFMHLLVTLLIINISLRNVLLKNEYKIHWKFFPFCRYCTRIASNFTFFSLHLNVSPKLCNLELLHYCFQKLFKEKFIHNNPTKVLSKALCKNQFSAFQKISWNVFNITVLRHGSHSFNEYLFILAKFCFLVVFCRVRCSYFL